MLITVRRPLHDADQVILCINGESCLNGVGYNSAGTDIDDGDDVTVWMAVGRVYE